MLRLALLALMIVIAGWTGSASAQLTRTDEVRLVAAREMMQVAGVAKQFDEMMPVLIEQLSRSFAAIAPDKAQEIREVFGQLSAKFTNRKGELIEQIAVLYANRLTADELNTIVSFYKSPTGAKFVAIQPEITREAMVAGQRWGERLGRELELEARRELKKRGVDL